MKNKNKIIAGIIIILVLLLALIIRNKKEYVIAVDEIPSEGILKMNSSELSLITKNLLYTPLIKLEKDGNYMLLTAKTLNIEDNKVIITVKNKNIAQKVYNSYINVMSNGYDDSIYCENIVGGREFIHGEKDLVEGIKLDENTLEFTVKDIEDLNFLTIPLQNVSKWKIKKITKDEILISKGLTSIKFVLSTSVKEKEFDLYLTKIRDEQIEGYNRKELSTHSNFVGVVNFDEKETNEIKDILNGDIVQTNIKEIMFWNDSSETGAYVLDDVKNKFEAFGVKVKVDYCPQSYLYKMMNNNQKFIFFYDGNYQDKEIFKDFDNFEYAEVKGADSLVYYNKDGEKFLKKFLKIK